MIIYKREKDLQQFLAQKKRTGNTIGFVPTMGALHKGHIGLISTASKDCTVLVSSIFVNPTQFNDPKDFEKYPHTIEKDIYALEIAGCDVLFLPSVQEMYPEGLQQEIKYDLGYLDTVLDAKYRPGHFQGVCRVVERLLKIVQPTTLYLGQKDYQQCMVIKKLIQITGLSIAVSICPTEREPNGLAMSSRNLRLNETDKVKASAIYRTLLFIQDQLKNGQHDLPVIKQNAEQILKDEGFTLDYVEIANADTLQFADYWDGKTGLVILIAAYLSGVRLIDNLTA